MFQPTLLGLTLASNNYRLGRSDYILTLTTPKEGIGLAVFDRLFKASGSRLIEID